MQKEKHTFKDWGYPFIAMDYEGFFGYKCPDKMLGGIVLFGDDTLEDVIKEVQNFINEKTPAIMVELDHIWNFKLKDSIVKALIELFEKNGYIDLQSYEHRLAYGKGDI